MNIVDLDLNEEYQDGLNKADVIRIPIEPQYAGEYRLEYDGKYITLLGRDKRYVGFKFSEEQEDWYEEMVLISCIVEVRKASPCIISVDDKWISVELGLNKSNI